MGGGHSRREDSFCRGRVVSGQGVFREQGLSWEGLMRGRTGALPPLCCTSRCLVLMTGIWDVDGGHKHFMVRLGWIRLQKHTTLRGLQRKFVVHSESTLDLVALQGWCLPRGGSVRVLCILHFSASAL